MKIISPFLFILVLFACKSSPDYFIGKWQILKVVNDNDTIDLDDNWMHLKEGGIFESYDGALKKNESGKWTYQTADKILFIEGEGEEGDSEWMISMQSDTLFFHSTSSALYLIAMKYSK
ncbi:MAG: hypothetical protein HKN68_16920 [Saprospiraceae bacterium]|nr:hypothetical protein [Saprospiraceae bacterium]